MHAYGLYKGFVKDMNVYIFFPVITVKNIYMLVEGEE